MQRMYSDLHQVVVTSLTALAEYPAVAMPVATGKVMCLLLIFLAASTPTDTLGSRSGASGLLLATHAAYAAHGRRQLLQQTVSQQPPALPAQDVPFAVRQLNIDVACLLDLQLHHQRFWTVR